MSVDSIKNFRNMEVPKKQAWLGMFFIGLSVFFWSLLTYSIILRVISPAILSFLILLGLAWAVVYGLLVLFADKRIVYFLYIFLGVLFMALYGFYDFNFIGVILFVLILFLGHFRADRFRDFIADFRPYHIIRRFMPLFFTGLTILLAFIYNSYVLKYYADDPHIPSGVYSVVFAPVEYSLEFMFNDYKRGSSVSEFQDVLLDSFFARFLPAEYATEFDPAYVPEFFGEDVEDMSVKDFSLIWFNGMMDNILAPYTSILPAFFIVGLFFVFRFVLLPFVWISTGLLLLAIHLLSLYNIIVIEEVTTVKKVPVLE